MRVTLRHITHSRAGDKGNTSNFAVIACDAALYPHIERVLTAQAVKTLYGTAVQGEVVRHEVDGWGVLNFVLQGALGGGVSRSLAIDDDGKALASAVLRVEVDVPDDLAPLLRGPRQGDKVHV